MDKKYQKVNWKNFSFAPMGKQENDNKLDKESDLIDNRIIKINNDNSEFNRKAGCVNE